MHFTERSPTAAPDPSTFVPAPHMDVKQNENHQVPRQLTKARGRRARDTSARVIGLDLSCRGAGAIAGRPLRLFNPFRVFSSKLFL
jgi:hypothetical protein